jgi:hypothetical protein
MKTTVTETIWQSQCLPQETARDGAARFVREIFNSERKIIWCTEPGMFRLVDGYWCYIITFNGGHWQVRRSHEMTPQAKGRAKARAEIRSERKGDA